MLEDGQYQRSTGGRDGTLPEWARNQPDLVRGDEFWLSAFWKLNTCRQFGMSVGPIPWIVIEHYADRFGLEPDIRDLLHVLVWEMDKAYLAYVRDEHSRSTESSISHPPNVSNPAGPTRRSRSKR